MIRQKRAKKIIWIGVALALLIAAIFLRKHTGNQTGEYSSDYVWNQEIPALMQFTYYTDAEWEEKLNTQGKMTYQDVTDLLTLLHLEDYIEVKTQGKYITRADWYQMYDQIVDILDENHQINKKMVLPLEAVKGSITTPEGTVETDLSDDWFEVFHAYTVYCMDNRIIGMAAVDEADYEIENVYITKTADKQISFLCQKQEYTVVVDGNANVSQVVADLIFTDGAVSTLQKKEDTITGKLITLTDTYAEIQGYGQVPLDSAMRIYSIYDGVTEADKESLLLENMDITFVVADEKVSAFLIESAVSVQNVRVLLLDDKNPYRTSVTISADVPLKLTYNDTEQLLDAGTVRTEELLEQLSHSSVTVEAQDGSSRLYLADDVGNRISLGYPGRLELRKYEEGYTVVNVVSLEDYVKGVLPSEMPLSFSENAFMAQAVCARSYAYIQLMNTKYQQFGAHVDDTVNYQVYNKSEQSDVTIHAVEATSGEVMRYQGEVVEAYYYSTSYGHTGSMRAWKLDETQYAYLAGTWVRREASNQDLSDEAAFLAYISAADDACYESGSKFFRWHTELDFTNQMEELYNIIEERMSVVPEQITLWTKDGSTPVDSVRNMGALCDITVNGRDGCGVIGELELHFADGMVRVTSEYNIRAILGCCGNSIVYQDGSTGEMSLLPSAYISVARQADGTYTIYGGGYGHGIGMSQNGAEQLSLAGYGYLDILQFFYQGIAVEQL